MKALYMKLLADDQRRQEITRYWQDQMEYEISVLRSKYQERIADVTKYLVGDWSPLLQAVRAIEPSAEWIDFTPDGAVISGEKGMTSRLIPWENILPIGDKSP